MSARTLYEIRIGAKGQEPRLRFCDYAGSTFEAVENNLWQREEGDRVEAFPVGEKPEAFAVHAERQALECGLLCEAAQPTARGLDLRGQKFGRLTAIEKVSRQGSHAYWMCECECGKMKSIRASSLQRGLTQSCGCLIRETLSRISKARSTTHGMYGSPTYVSWANMKNRCVRPAHSAYHAYGGRGIKVCERWMTFANFLADMGERPPGMTIDRWPDKNGNYEPGNCRWATLTEQQCNTSINHLIEYQGRVACIAEWERILGMPRNTLRSRLRMGWSMDRAVNTPLRPRLKEIA